MVWYNNPQCGNWVGEGVRMRERREGVVPDCPASVYWVTGPRRETRWPERGRGEREETEDW